MDSNLTFENHQNSVLSKIANANRSFYLVRNQIPLKVRIDVFKSVVLSSFFQWSIPSNSYSEKHKPHKQAN